MCLIVEKKVEILPLTTIECNATKMREIKVETEIINGKSCCSPIRKEEKVKKRAKKKYIDQFDQIILESSLCDCNFVACSLHSV